MRRITILMMALLMGASLNSAAGVDRLARLEPVELIMYDGRVEPAGNDVASARMTESPGARATLGFKVGFLVSPNMSDFSASSDSGRASLLGGSSFAEKSIRSSGSFGIALDLGLEFRGDSADVAFLFGAGALLNNDVDSGYTEFVIEPLFKVSETVKIGPVLGLMNFSDSKWEESNSWTWDTSEPDVEFKGGAGARIGLKLVSRNSDGGSFVCSISYMSFAYEVVDARHDPTKRWTANNDELDLSGLLFYIGGRF